jgi:hypothetical protein
MEREERGKLLFSSVMSSKSNCEIEVQWNERDAKGHYRLSVIFMANLPAFLILAITGLGTVLGEKGSQHFTK